MVGGDGQGLHVGKQLASASPHENKLIKAILEASFAPSKVQRLIYDKAADGDALRQRRADGGVSLIAPQLRL